MKYSNIALICCIMSFVACSGNVANVKLSGSLKQFGMSKVAMNYAGISSDIYNNKTVELIVDSNGMFSIELYLETPTYYTVGENMLYLSPNDDLKIVFNRNPEESVFKGQGSEFNNYLKKYNVLNKLFSFGWNFEILQKPPMDFATYKQKTDSVVHERMKDLLALPKTSGDFQEIERIRILAGQLLTYLNYFSVGRLSEWNDTPKVKLEKKQSYYCTIKDLVEPLLNEIITSEVCLELPEVRKVLVECFDTKVFDFKITSQFKEYVDVLNTSIKLDSGIMRKDYEMYKTFGEQIQNKDLRMSYLAKLQARTKLMEGNSAIDFTLRDIEGKEYHLSDFKGKVIFIDIWATWCLPCLAQKPDFEKLSEQYPQILFLGVSVDQKIEWWKQKLEKDGMPIYVKEFIADPYELEKTWDLTSIPRFILIDKNFCIVNAFAPRPSEYEKIVKMLDRLSVR